MFAVRTLRATLSIWVEQSIIWAGFNNKLTLWHWHKQSHCELLTFSKILFKSEPCVSVQTSTLIRSACCTHILCIAYVLVYLKVVWRNEARCLWKVKRNVCVHRHQTERLCAEQFGPAWLCLGCDFVLDAGLIQFISDLGKKITIQKITFIHIHNIEMIQLKTNLTWKLKNCFDLMENPLLASCCLPPVWITFPNRSTQDVKCYLLVFLQLKLFF